MLFYIQRDNSSTKTGKLNKNTKSEAAAAASLFNAYETTILKTVGHALFRGFIVAA